MSDNQNLIGVLAAVDQAVLDHPERRADVAAVLPAYRDRHAVGWSRAFASWVEARTTAEAALPLPPVDHALDALATTRSQAPPGPRRERAVLGLAAAVPERFGPQGTERVAVENALPPPTPADDVVRREVTASPRTASFSADLLMRRVTPANRDPVAALSTRLTNDRGHSIDNVDELLHPTLWHELSPDFWAGMTVIDEETGCYQEDFTVADTLALRPILTFASRSLSEDPESPAHALEYRLCRHPEHYDGEGDGPESRGFTHDEGAIVTRQLGGRLTVKTTKRVGFVGPFSGAGLVMAAEALGYPEAFEDMVRRALQVHALAAEERH